MRYRRRLVWVVLAGLGLGLVGCGEAGLLLSRNHAPQISAFIVAGHSHAFNVDGEPIEVDGLTVGQTVSVQCVATDRDGDDLRYAWTGVASTVAAPSSVDVLVSSAQHARLNCTVTDARNGVATASLVLVFAAPTRAASSQ